MRHHVHYICMLHSISVYFFLLISKHEYVDYQLLKSSTQLKFHPSLFTVTSSLPPSPPPSRLPLSHYLPPSVSLIISPVKGEDEKGLKTSNHTTEGGYYWN